MPRVTNRNITVPFALNTVAPNSFPAAEANPTAGVVTVFPTVTTGVIADNFTMLEQPLTALTPTFTAVGHVMPVNVSAFDHQQLVDHRQLAYYSVFQAFQLMQPRPRDEITVPISPSEKITEDTIFTDPDASTGKRYFIPTFSLAEQTLDGTRRLRATMREVEEGWLLTVTFASGARSGGTEAIQTSFAPLLRFTKPTAPDVVKEMPLVLEQEDDTTWKASLTMRGGLTERDEVFHALTKTEYHTQFILRCKFKAAVPEPKKKPGDEQLYMPGSHTVDVALNHDPFNFDVQLHPYIFEDITNVSDRTFGLLLRQVEWRGRMHHYYQDEASPYKFYYLPDAFKITRKSELPYTPNMRVRFTSEDGSLERMRVSLEYVAVPVVEPERLENAAQELEQHLPSPMPTNITDAVFQLLVVNNVEQLQLKLALPRADTSGTLRQERPGIVSNLTEHFVDAIDLTMSNFQTVFDALFGKSAVVFSGKVFVGGGDQRPDAVVPFEARLDDLHGPMLEALETPNADGTVGLTLRNGCESPMVVHSIPLQIVTEGKVLAARADNLTRDGESVEFPVKLAQDQALALKVVPDPPEAVNGTSDALFNLDDVEVQPDPEAVWSAILDASVPAEYTRTIEVKGFKEWFEQETGVRAIGIDFENGDSVTLEANFLEAKGHIRVPVSDLVLRKEQKSEYRYTQVTVHKSGRQTRTQKSDSLDLLFPEVAS